MRWWLHKNNATRQDMNLWPRSCEATDHWTIVWHIVRVRCLLYRKVTDIYGSFTFSVNFRPCPQTDLVQQIFINRGCQHLFSKYTQREGGCRLPGLWPGRCSRGDERLNKSERCQTANKARQLPVPDSVSAVLRKVSAVKNPSGLIDSAVNMGFL